MADNTVEILIKARDEATRVFREVNKGADELQGNLSGFTRFIPIEAAVGTAVLGMGAAVFTAARQASDLNEQLDRISRRTRVASETLQVMRAVIAESGGNAESLTTALTFLNRAIADQNPLLRQLGITTRDAGAAFLQLGRIFASSSDQALKTKVAFELLGRGGAEVIADIEDIASAFPQMDAALRQSGALITSETAPALRELDDELDRLARNWTGAWRSIGSAVAPAVAEVLKGINDMTEAARRLSKGAPLSAFGGGAFRGAGALAGQQLNQAGTAEQGPHATLEQLMGGEQARQIAEQRARFARMAEGNVIDAAREAAAQQPRTILRDRGKVVADDLAETREAVLGEMELMLQGWREFTDQITSSASIVDAGIRAVFDGLQNGFQQAFHGLISGAMNLRQAMTAIFRALVDEIIRELARIAAAQVFSQLLKLGLNIASGGSAIPFAPITPALDPGAGGIFRSRRGEGNTYNTTISTIDAKSFLDLMRSPSGAINAAEFRVAEAGIA
ncbi:MAG: Paracoccus phage Shpa [Actinomycetota bacterium]|jgi:hypothetical protein